MKKLQDDQVDIQDARRQGYDNGANMAGNYRGVQARIQEKIISLFIYYVQATVWIWQEYIPLQSMQKLNIFLKP